MSEMRYENFDLTIQKEGDGYRARADSPAGQSASTFSMPFSPLEMENFVLITTPGRRSTRRIDTPEVASAKRFGERLFASIFTGELLGRFHSALNDAYHNEGRLRIRLRLTDTPELADLPWEYLYNPSLNRFLALDDDTAIVRFLDLPERVRPVDVTLPLKVLVAISDPNDYPKLDIEQEWANLNEALSGLGNAGLLSLDLLEDATMPRLRKQLAQDQYHIFHFIGHGGFDRQAEEGVLILKDDYGRGRQVSGQQLGWLMHNHKTLALAVLNACEGARADSTDAFAGTAQSLVQQGVPAVVAMQREITDDAAKTFASAFYSALAGGRPVESALTETRLAIFAEAHGLEWATPVLYMRAPNGHLFDLKTSSAPPEPKRQPQAQAPAPQPVSILEENTESTLALVPPVEEHRAVEASIGSLHKEKAPLTGPAELRSEVSTPLHVDAAPAKESGQTQQPTTPSVTTQSEGASEASAQLDASIARVIDSHLQTNIPAKWTADAHTQIDEALSQAKAVVKVRPQARKRGLVGAIIAAGVLLIGVYFLLQAGLFQSSPTNSTTIGTVYGVAFLPDEHSFVSLVNNHVVVWDASSGQGSQPLAQGDYDSMVVSMNGKVLGLTASTSVDIWDLTSNRELKSIMLGTYPGGVALSSDGSMVATVRQDNNTNVLEVWRTSDGKMLANNNSFNLGTLPEGRLLAAFSPSGNVLAVIHWNTGEVSAGDRGYFLTVYETTQWSLKDQISVGGLNPPTIDITHLTFSPDGRSMSSVWGDSQIRTWGLLADGGLNGETIAPYNSDTSGSGQLPITYSRNSKTLAIGLPSGEINTYQIGNTSSDEHKPNVGEGIFDMAYSSDGNTMLVGSATHIYLWDLANNRAKLTISGVPPNLK